MSCRSGCPTRDHGSYAECLRAARVRLGDVRGEGYKLERELALYRSARAQGVQPAGTSTAQVRAALDASDRLGRAADAGVSAA